MWYKRILWIFLIFYWNKMVLYEICLVWSKYSQRTVSRCGYMMVYILMLYRLINVVIIVNIVIKNGYIRPPSFFHLEKINIKKVFLIFKIFYVMLKTKYIYIRIKIPTYTHLIYIIITPFLSFIFYFSNFTI